MNDMTVHRALDRYRHDPNPQVREAALVVQRAIENKIAARPGRKFYAGKVVWE